ncbi:MAG: BamA/TamA family outer membrane protein, partial [Deltaproteobacteria bacterium]|nr:BamA/TamA family outer membrane protein [Deltaproteobacteria bacterium]
GRLYSRADLEDARTALVNLGVFGRVDLRQDLGRPESGIVPLTVVVDEAPLRTLRVGGGSRFDVLEWSSHLTFAWEHRNFLGGLRRFSVESRPGLVFFPTRIDNLVAPTEVLPRNRVRAELRQPSFLEGRTTGLVAAEFNVYPVLYPGAGAAGENVIGYVEVKGQGALERSFLGHHVYVSPSMNWQGNTPFAYLGEARLDPVQVSYPAVRAVLDLRNDAIEPRRGMFLAASFEAAGGPFGGDADDVRVQPDLRTYVPISPEVTFATRATVGFLFPRNYGSTLQDPTANLGSARALRDQQLLLLRAFYSGGPSSNRGYAFRGVGPQGPLGFLLPSTARCDLTSTDPLCFRPLGGLSLWEASFEVRYPVFGALRGAVFLDASDVSREVASIGFQVPHLSPGLGLRYGTPVGPIRLDVGYRLPFVQRVGEREARRDEGDPGTVAGLPIAVHFGLGEAF